MSFTGDAKSLAKAHKSKWDPIYEAEKKAYELQLEERTTYLIGQIDAALYTLINSEKDIIDQGAVIRVLHHNSDSGLEALHAAARLMRGRGFEVKVSYEHNDDSIQIVKVTVPDEAFDSYSSSSE